MKSSNDGEDENLKRLGLGSMRLGVRLEVGLGVS